MKMCLLNLLLLKRLKCLTAKTYFLSDSHLEDSRPEVASLFLRFLRKGARQAQALYLLGDIFNVWVGDDHLTTVSKQVQQELKLLHKLGVKLFFVAGNRDFLVGKSFLNPAGIILLKDPTMIELYGKKIWLGHGDTLCTDDRKYQRFRRLVRNPIIKRLYLSLPLSRRKNIASNLRHKSIEYQKHMNLQLTDVNTHTVEREFDKHHVSLMIHGHTHRPQQHRHRVNNTDCTRFVLGDWHEHQAYILCATPQDMKLIDLTKQIELLQDLEDGNSTLNEMVLDSETS